MWKATVTLVGLLVSLTIPNGDLSKFLDRLLYAHEEAGAIPPFIPTITGDSHSAYLYRLLTAAHNRGLNVVFDNDIKVGDEPVWGYYVYESKTIYIELGLTKNAQFATLLHEMGHAFEPPELSKITCRKDRLGKEHCRRLLWREEQVFAEAVSILGCRELKLDITYSSFSYLQQFPTRHQVLITFAKEIDTVVNTLIGEIR